MERAPQQQENSRTRAVMEIGTILGEVAVIGFNDSELGELRQLMEDVEAGKIDPQTALERAHEIAGAKMDYH